MDQKSETLGTCAHTTRVHRDMQIKAGGTSSALAALGRYWIIHYKMCILPQKKKRKNKKKNPNQTKTGLWWACGHRSLLTGVHGALHQGATGVLRNMPCEVQFMQLKCLRKKSLGEWNPGRKFLFSELPYPSCGRKSHRITHDVLERWPTIKGWLDKRGCVSI